MKTDYTNVARVIAATTGQAEKKVLRDMNNQTSLMPEQAKKYGLVNEIKSQLLPAGAGMIVIYEDASITEIQAAPQQLTLPPTATTEVPETTTGSSFAFVTSTPMGFTGKYSGSGS